MVDPEAITGWWSDVWNNAQWVRSIRNSFYIGILATILSLLLGHLRRLALLRRYAMASSDYGAVDFADDRSIGDWHRFGLLLCGHQIG